MSLLHTVLSGGIAAMRRAEAHAWPPSTSFAADDVLVDRTSLAGLARHYPTPRVYVPVGTDLARIERYWGEAPCRTVVLARVEDDVPRLADGPRQVWLDADLDTCAAVIEEARLLGRASRGPLRRFTVHPAPGRTGRFARLPADTRRGDVLAIPCTGVVLASDIQR